MKEPMLEMELTEGAVVDFLMAFAVSARQTLGVAEPVDSMMLVMVGMRCALRRPEVAHALLAALPQTARGGLDEMAEKWDLFGFHTPLEQDRRER